MISPNIIIPFDGDHADIPTGFTRDTRFDGKFVKGASSGLADTGGATTHTHTSSAHTHTMVNHTHTMTIGGQTGGSGYDNALGGDATDLAHTHWGSTPKTSTSLSGGSLVATVAYPSSTHIPPYYKFIFIKSLGYNLFPISGITLRADTTRSNANFHSASASKYMVGAGTGENAGGTGGATTHTHSLNHTHSGVNHSHTGVAEADTSKLNSKSGTPYEITGSHSHTLTWNNTSLTGSAATLTSGTGDNSPLAGNVNLFKFSEVSVPIPGDIAMITETDTPIGWVDCDGSEGTPNLVGYYIKNKASASNGITTSGANTHTHAANNSHAHGTSLHTHTGSVSTFNANKRPSGNAVRSSTSHTHSVGTITSANASWNNALMPAGESQSNEPPYIKVKFIQLKFVVTGAALMAIL